MVTKYFKVLFVAESYYSLGCLLGLLGLAPCCINADTHSCIYNMLCYQPLCVVRVSCHLSRQRLHNRVQLG